MGNRESKIDESIYIALFNYKSRSKKDISFSKGDILRLIIPSTKGTDWLEVVHCRTKVRGFVPSQYVAVKGTLEAEDWFFGSISRQEAEELVLVPENPNGTFLLRPSESTSSYSLTVKDYGSHNSVCARNYRIKKNNKQGYCIFKEEHFKTIQDLVRKYQRSQGLRCKLGMACPRPSPQLWDLTPEMQEIWEIDKGDIKLFTKIGSGNFGEVWYGKWNGTTEVAVKTMKPGSMSKEAFLQEAAIMKRFRHTRLVALYAVCTLDEPLYIVTEYMKNGSLLDYLRKNGQRSIKKGHLVYIASQIATGMTYLEEKNLVHRDLAARNILIGENNTAKIADFGLARVLTEDNRSQSQPTSIAVKWAAPEVLRCSMFTTKSDVWSFGVVLIETFTYGAKPYPEMTPKEVSQEVIRGYVMAQPSGFPNEVYEIVLKCWAKTSEDRPTFKYLAYYFENYATSNEKIYE